MVDLNPRSVALHGLCVNGAIDKVEQSESAEGQLKERTP